jgi:glutaminyl-tRNA synthetase
VNDSPTAPPSRDFIRDIVAADVAAADQRPRHALPARAQRLPPHRPRQVDLPELRRRREFGGRCNLRFDDTNPVKEEQEYIDAIEADVRWLGFDWGDGTYHASDYFEQLYAWASTSSSGLRYVDDQTPTRSGETRGTLTAPGVDSPFRDRSVEENLDLLERMRGGEFPNGARVLRAKIDMASRTSTFATRSCTGSSTRRTRAPVTPGASTRRTTSPTASRTRSRA